MVIQVGYYAIPRPGSSDNTTKTLAVENIDPFLCTHIIVAFARIRGNVISPEAERDVEIYKKVVDLKKQNPNLKILLSLGGGSSDSGFPTLVKDEAAVIQFASSTREFLLNASFDGLDLDWEFPAWPMMMKDKCEKQLFSRLVNHLHASLKQTPSLLLTIAVGGPKTIIDRSYEVDELAKHVDFVSLMGYDYHIFWPYLPFTGHNAPLVKRSGEMSYFATMNIEWSAFYLIQKGLPKEKLVIGIPTYGRTWRLLNSSWCNIGSPAVSQGMLNGSLSYSEAMKFLKDGAKEYFDEDSRVPYSVKNRDWVSYENSKSISEKACWVKSHGFAGIMTWNLNCDDWEGTHSGEQFELHRIIKAIILDNDERL